MVQVRVIDDFAPITPASARLIPAMVPPHAIGVSRICPQASLKPVLRLERRLRGAAS